MRTILNHFLLWTPRVLGLVFAAFISIFALDVFGEAHGFWQTARALLIHLIPTAILLGLLALSWRWEWVGGILFPTLGALYLVTAWGRFHWSASVVIGGPLFVLGGLFLAHWLYSRTLTRSV